MFQKFQYYKQSIFAFSGNIIYTFSIWLISILINNQFGTKALGEFSLIQAIISPLAIFFHLQFKVLCTIETNIKHRFPFYHKAILISELFFLIISLSIGFFLNQSGLFYAFLFFKIMESYSNFLQGVHQSVNDFRYGFLSSFFRSFLLICLLLIAMLVFKSLFIGFGLVCAASLILFVFWEFPKLQIVTISLIPSGNIDVLRKLIQQGVILSIIAFSDSLLISIPRFILINNYDELALGKFTIVIHFFIAVSIFVISFGHPLLVRLKNHLKENALDSFLYEIKSVIKRLVLIAVIINSSFFICGEYLLEMVWGEEARVLNSELQISMLGVFPLFMSSIFVYVISSLKYFKLHLIYYPIIIIFQIVCSIYLIPNYGLKGAVISVFLTQILRMLLSGLAAYWSFKHYKNNKLYAFN